MCILFCFFFFLLRLWKGLFHIYYYTIFVLGTTHSVRAEEEDAYADWINTNLASDADVKHLVPISGKDLYQKITDGILIVWVELMNFYHISINCIVYSQRLSIKFELGTYRSHYYNHRYLTVLFLRKISLCYMFIVFLSICLCLECWHWFNRQIM